MSERDNEAIVRRFLDEALMLADFSAAARSQIIQQLPITGNIKAV
jgi:hypothetical protein